MCEQPYNIIGFEDMPFRMLHGTAASGCIMQWLLLAPHRKDLLQRARLDLVVKHLVGVHPVLPLQRRRQASRLRPLRDRLPGQPLVIILGVTPGGLGGEVPFSDS